MKSLLESLVEAVQGPTIQQKIEDYIASKNPQSVEDVERLEREFLRSKQSLSSFERYY